MSAPTTRDPLVVNTQDGACWMRRAVTRDGHGLYALAGTVAGAPDEVLATIPELAADHKLASMAFALPMPVGSTPPVPEVVRLRAELVAAEQRSERRRIAWRMAYQRAQGRGWAADRAGERVRQGQTALQDLLEALLSMQMERDAALARVTELLAERHSTNEALDDAVKALRADRGALAVEDQVVAYYDPRRPQTLLCREHGPRYIGMAPVTAAELPDGGICTYGDLSTETCGRDVLAEGPKADGITRRIAPVQALREDTVQGEHYPAVHHTYRVPRDLPAPDGAQ